MKNSIFLFFIIIFITNVSAFNLKVSPPYINLSGDINNELCERISLIGDNESRLNVSVYWSKKNSKNLRDYVYNSEELDIKNKFPDDLKITNSINKYDFCFIFNNSGNYNGALIFSDKNKIAGVGVWIKASINGNNINYQEKETEFARITGSSILDNNSLVKSSLIISCIFLFIVLILLLIARRLVSPEH